MKYLKHKEIDPVKWDGLLNKVNHVHFYFLYNYLCNICKWDAIVIERKDKYELILPIPFKQKLWLKYFYQPFFCQQLGIVSEKVVSTDQLKGIKEILEKKFSFGRGNWSSLNLVNEVFNTQDKTNYVLAIDTEYENLKQNYNTNRKRTLKKLANKEYEVEVSSEIKHVDKTISKFSELFEHIIPEIKKSHYKQLKLALKAIKSESKLSAHSIIYNDETLSSALFIEFQNRIVYLLGYTEEDYRKESVQSLIFDDLIHTHRKSLKLIDFEGGSSSGIGRFYASFGAKVSHYKQIAVNDNHLIFRKIFR